MSDDLGQSPASNLVHPPGLSPRVADELRFGAEHRFAVATVAPRLRCTRCEESGWRPLVDEAGVSRVAKCVCRRAHDRAHLWGKALVPGKHAESTIESWRTPARRDDDDDDDPATTARTWLAAERPAGGLLFSGPPGVGKTHLAVGLLRELVIERGVEGRFVNFGHLVAQMKARASGSEVRGPSPAEVAASPALVLDDVSAVSTDFERGVADELITRIYDAAGLLIVTTNAASVDELTGWVGARCGSRLVDMVRWVKCAAPDRRRHGAPSPLPFPPSGVSR